MPGLSSLSKSLVTRLGERRAQCAILELDEKDKAKGEYLAFQYFPESISDTKAVNYATKDIPGGSLPLYQWVSSGERILSFTSIFTSDVDLLQDPSLYAKLVSKGQVRRNLDIRMAILWLRRFMLPRYGADTELGQPLTQAPRKMILRVQNSGIGLSGGVVDNTLSPGGSGGAVESGGSDESILTDSIFAIMTQCDVTYDAFFPSGLPRIATVQLSFAQIGQIGGVVRFPHADPLLDSLVSEGQEGQRGFFPYPVKVKFK